MIIIITAVISIELYLTNKGDHTMLYKISNNFYIKTSTNIRLYSHNVVFLTHIHAHTHKHACTCTYTQKECNN